MTNNPLFDAWLELHGQDAEYSASFGSRRYENFDVEMDAYKERHALIKRYSFAVPTEEAIELIASYGPVVEVGAGTGYWADLLRDRTTCFAYDIQGEAWERWFPSGKYAHVVEGDGPVVVKQHADCTLLMVWPYMDSMAYDTLRSYEAAGGQRLVYVGEGLSGCCANDDFFAYISDDSFCWHLDEEPCEHERGPWQKVKELAIPQWAGLHDYLTVYERTDQ